MATDPTVHDIPSDPAQRRAWFQHELKKHTNTETKKPWTQADVSRKADCSEGQVSMVYAGKRTYGDVTKRVQRVTAKALNSTIAILFGTVCKQCTNCGTAHAPKRMNAEEDAPELATA